MPTSAPGSSRHASAAVRGFTLLELLLVIAVVAIGTVLVAMALPDGDRGRLEEEAERLAALLETARAEARIAGVPVWWRPRADDDAAPATDGAGRPYDFRFVGLPGTQVLPQRWLDGRTAAQVVGAPQLVLGPEAILPPQRVLLSLGTQRLALASDGLAPFGIVAEEEAAP